MAIDIDQSFYNTGTASVNNGATVVNGQGTQWLSSIRANDIFGTHKGDGVRILSVESNTSLTLAYPWTGDTQASAPYEVQFTPYDTGYYPAVRQLLQTMASGNVESFAALNGSPDKGIMFTGSGTVGTFDLPQRGRDLISGVSATGLSVAVAANAADARSAIGAQTNLGYAPVNRAGDAGLTGNYIISSPDQYSRYLRLKIFGASSEYQIDLNGEYASSPLNTMHAYLRVKGLVGDAYFRFNSSGSLVVPGALSKGSGTFLIDHPLDPFNKNLRHGFVESTEYVNIYRGMVDLVDGRMTVDIDAAFGMTDGTFAALNADVMVSSLQNQYGPHRVWVEAPADSGKFTIICEDPESTATISWMVTGRRNDAFVRSDLDPNTDSEGRFIPEFDKEDA